MSLITGDRRKQIKEELIDELKKEHAFWSYNLESVNSDSMTDEMLIGYTLRYLDLEDINKLYLIFSPRKIKCAWINSMVPEGEYLHTLNRFLAWHYFKAKNPDAYLKSLQTRHLNKLLAK